MDDGKSWSRKTVAGKDIEAFARQLAEMKANGTYDKWRNDLCEQTDRYERSPAGRLKRIFSGVRMAWSCLVKGK